MKSQGLFSFVLAFLITCSVSAFSTPSRPILTPGRLIQGQQQKLSTFVLRAEESKETAPAPKIDFDGTYYDDEVEPAPKQGISDSMKERLKREAATGLDPDTKNANVILYIMAAVAVLVLVGGQGILY